MKYPAVPPIFCPAPDCGPAYRNKLRMRQSRKPTLSEHVIDVLSTAGYGNASRGAQNLITAHKQDPIALTLDWRKLRKPWAHLPYSKQITRIARLYIDQERYDTLRMIHDANAHTMPPEQRRRPGRGGLRSQGATCTMAPALTALTNRFESDPEYRKAVLKLTPAVERAIHDEVTGNEKEWLS